MEDINILYLIIDLIITAFCYMVIPTFIKTLNKTYTNKEANIICLLNSIVVCIFFIILREALGIIQPKIVGGPALFYYFINKHHLLKGTSSKKDNQTNVEMSQASNERNSKNNINLKQKKHKREKKKYNINYRLLIIILISVLIAIFLFIGTYFLVDYIDSLKYQIESSQNSYNSIKTRYETLRKEYSDKQLEYQAKDAKIDFFDEHIVFVLDGYGNYYYTYDQMKQVTQGKEYSFGAYNKEAAISKGYKAFPESSWDKYKREHD